MIARIWKGTTRAADADAYYDYLQQTGLPEYRSVEGNRGVIVLRRITGDEAEFTLITFWESMDAVRGFAGDQPEQAKFYPADDDYLLDRGPLVAHYEVLEGSVP
jgi:heme-degrading monooxygenase HmoA